MRRLALLIVPLALALAVAAPASAHKVFIIGSEYSGGGGEAFRHDTPFYTGDAEGVLVEDSNASQYVLNSDGAVQAAGENTHGQLGDGSMTGSESLVTVELPKGVTVRSMGEADAEAVAVTTSGTVYGWGWNRADSLCVPGEDKETPATLPLSNIVAAAGGGEHMLYLTGSGNVLACGRNLYGELGVGERPAASARPMEVPGLTSVKQITAGGGDSCALTVKGEVWCWGSNLYGKVGVGSTARAIFTPTHVSLPEAAVEIYAGGDNKNGATLALTASHTLYAWGDGGSGALGTGSKEDEWSPVDTGMHYESIATGGQNSFGITSGGELFAWGSDSACGLGNGRCWGAVLTPTLLSTGVLQVSSTATSAMYLVE